MIARALAPTLALLSAILLAPPSARAEEGVIEIYASRMGDGREAKTLYDDQRALWIADADAAENARPAEGELRAWLSARDLDPADLAPRLGETTEAFLDRVDEWLGLNAFAPRSLLVVVLDGRTEARGSDEVLTLSSPSGTIEVPLADLLDRIDSVARAGHVLVVASGQVLRTTWSMREEPGGDRPLGRDAGQRARLLLTTHETSFGDDALGALSAGLRGDLGATFDSDGFVAATDLVRARPDLSLHRFARDEGGMVVLGSVQSFERPIGSDAIDRRTAYEAVRGRLDAAAFEAFLDTHGRDHRDAAWALARIEALEAQTRRETARFCEAELAFEPKLIMRLGVSTVGEIPSFRDPSDLARAWLDAIVRASGVDRARAARIVERCDAASVAGAEGTLGLAIAALAAGEGAAGVALRLTQPLSQGPSEGLAVLGGLVALAEAGHASDMSEGWGAFEATNRYALSRAAGQGGPAVRVVEALGVINALDSRPEDRAEAVERIRAAAEGGMALARGLYGVMALSDHDVARQLARQGAIDGAFAEANLVLAKRQGLDVDASLVSFDALDGARRARLIEGCDAALAFDAVALFDVWTLVTQRDLADLVDRPSALAARRLAEARLDWQRACAGIEEVSGVPSDLALRLGIVHLAEGARGRAAVFLKAASGAPLARFLDVVALLGRDQAEGAQALAALAASGNAFARLYHASLTRDAATGTVDAGARAGLDALARDGVPAALFLSSILAYAENAPAASLRAHRLMRLAAGAGFEVAESETAVEGAAGKALLDGLGLGLRRLRREDVAALGAFRDGSGVVVVAVAPGSPAEGVLEPGEVISRVNRFKLDSDPQQAFGVLLQEAARNTTLFLKATGARNAAGVRRLTLPPALAAALTAVPDAMSTPPGTPRTTGGQPATVHAGPGAAFAVRTTTRPTEGVRVLPLDIEDRWLHVRLERDGEEIEGWIRRDALAPL